MDLKIPLHKALLLTFIALAVSFTLPVTAGAEDGYLYGQVVSMTESEAVISNYDYDLEQTVDMTVNINSETQISGRPQEGEVAGLWAEVEYITDGSAHTALSIAIDDDSDYTEDIGE